MSDYDIQVLNFQVWYTAYRISIIHGIMLFSNEKTQEIWWVNFSSWNVEV